MIQKLTADETVAPQAKNLWKSLVEMYLKNRNKKCKDYKCKFFLTILINHWQINLDEWEWSKGVIFCYYILQRVKLLFRYLPSLITPRKCVILKAEIKTIMQYDNLAACFKNKSKVTSWIVDQTSKRFLIKTQLKETGDILHINFH